MSESSDPSPEPEPQAPAKYPRMSLAALACLVWLAVYLPIGFLAYRHVLVPMEDWVDRQDWLIRNIGPFFVWLSYFIVLAVGVAMTLHTWKYFTGGYEEPPAPSVPIATPGRVCPQCESEWDGRKCAKCGFTHNPWKKGTTSNG